MNEKIFDILEFSKIQEMLEKHATSQPGRTLCRNLMPETEIEVIQRMQDETSAARERIRHNHEISFAKVTDLSSVLERLEAGNRRENCCGSATCWTRLQGPRNMVAGRSRRRSGIFWTPGSISSPPCRRSARRSAAVFARTRSCSTPQARGWRRSARRSKTPRIRSRTSCAPLSAENTAII